MNFEQFFEYMELGGSIMWIILALSVLAVAIVIERFIFFAVSSANHEKLEAAFAESISENGVPRFAVPGKSSLHRLFFAACEYWELNDEKLEAKLKRETQRELYRWERNLPLLEVITRAAPLLGLLGTVLGMVEMFGAMSIGGAVNARAVTGGIWKALFTTVAGLSVAIPVLIAYSILSGIIDKEEETLERGSGFIMDKRADSSSFPRAPKS